jgi:hypothetical protein
MGQLGKSLGKIREQKLEKTRQKATLEEAFS